MVVDDAICLGAEVVSVTNTLDSPGLDQNMVEGLMMGLKKAALEEKVVVPGGELAELGDALNGAVWNATAVGVVEKDRVVTGKDILPGDVILGLKSDGIRSNGLSLARLILKEAHGENWHEAEYESGQTWGEVILTPSRIYHRALLNIIGAYQEKRNLSFKGLVHNTGGGIRGNLPRLLKKRGLGAHLDHLIEPHAFMKKMMELGSVEKEEAYKTWNMGIGMMMVVEKAGVDEMLEALRGQGIEVQVMGQVTEETEIVF